MDVKSDLELRIQQKSWPLLPKLFKFLDSFEENLEGLLLVFLDFLTLNEYLKLRNLNSRAHFSKQFFFKQDEKIKKYLLENGNGMS